MREICSLNITPIGWREACAFVDDVHRHHSRPQGYKFAVGISDGNRLCGVGMAGIPIARLQNDGVTLEIIRVAVQDQVPNGCSMIYGALWRAGRALGYRRGLTYTQEGESGASLRASGWTVTGEIPPSPGWNRSSRARTDRGTDGVLRYRWEVKA